MGFLVSIGAPSGSHGEEQGATVDKKKVRAEAAAKRKNLELLRRDPPRLKQYLCVIEYFMRCRVCV